MSLALAAPLANGWGMHDGGGGWWVVMMPMMMLFWGAVIFGIFWLVRGTVAGRPSSSGDPESALQILERRFAEGAISPEDYEARREILINGRRR